MKHFILLTFLSISSITFAQKKLSATIDSTLIKFKCVDQDLVNEDSAYIEIFYPDGQLAASGYSNIDGRIDFLLKEGATYKLRATKYGTTKDLAPIECPVYENQRKTKSIRLKINFYEKKYAEKWELAVYFKTDEHTLDFEDLSALNALYDKLSDNTEMNIEIAAHTDNIGNDAYNMRLSQRRANSVRQYLIGKGISSSRIISKGYGEKEPVATNDTEEGRAKNRRVEVRVLAI